MATEEGQSMGVLWDNSAAAFLILTCLLGGGAAWQAGRSLALRWRPYWQVIVYMSLFGLAIRFFQWGLADGTLLSLHYYLIDTLVLIIAASLGYRITRTGQMVSQYRWLYRRTSPLTWTTR
jgi:hypothetical protein